MRWVAKFRRAFVGLARGVRGQDSFLVHFAVATAVIILAALLRPALWAWCVLLLCITLVLSAEMFNTAIEVLVRRLHPERHDEIGKALDVAAAAVLIAAIGAALVGLLVLADAALTRFQVG